MNKSIYIKEINMDLTGFDLSRLKEIFDFVKFLKFKDETDPTSEIMSDRILYNKIKKGISDKNEGKLHNWEDVK
jgi:hypothetical protein